MLTLIFWTGIGALVGWVAANQRGFPLANGVLAGALLGLFSPLLFLAGRSGAGATRKCPHCAEVVRREARVCRHCGRDLPAAPAMQQEAVASAPFPWRFVTYLFVIPIGVVVVIVVYVMLAA